MTRSEELIQRSYATANSNAVKVLAKSQIEEIYSHVATLNGMAVAMENAGFDSSSRILVREFQSDILHSVISLASGYLRLSRVTLRQAIEACVFFQFFQDHPHEFALWEKGFFQPKVKETNSKLRLFHTNIISSELNWWLDMLDSHYAVLSSSVHPSAGFLTNNLSDNLNMQAETVDEVAEWAKVTRCITRSMICLTYARQYQVFEGGKHLGLKQEIRDRLTVDECDKLNKAGFVL